MSEFLDAFGASGGAGVASVASNAINGLMNVGFNSWNTSNQLDAQFRNWKKQFNLINEYNKPINQMSRFQEAGLNPNLIYGQSNATSSTPSMGTPYQGSNSNVRLMGPLEYQQYKTSKENARQAAIQSDILSEHLDRERIQTDEALQKHITNMYDEQNNLRRAIALGGYWYNPFITSEWSDRHGRAFYGGVNDYVWNATGSTNHDRGYVGTLPVQFDNSLLSEYLMSDLYNKNGMFGYNIHDSAEARANSVNDAEELRGLLDWSNLNNNFGKLTELYRLGLRNDKQGLNQEFNYNNRTFDSMTQAAISGFREAVAKNNLLTLMHAGGYLGNESPLLRFFGKKTGHSGFDELYSFPNYLKMKGDALWNAISQMGVDVAGAYLSRGSHKPFNTHNVKIGHQSWTDYK